MKYVFAGTKREYDHWCVEQEDFSYDSTYISRPEILAGLAIPGREVVYVGTWRTRPDRKLIEERLNLCAMMAQVIRR